VLAYGVATAAVLRLVVIALGTELVDNFRYVNLAFAAFLLLNAAQLLAGKDGEDEDLSDKWIVKACRCAPFTTLNPQMSNSPPCSRSG
jgi:predicted tellurium resistance membrane protein TerC